MSDDFQYRGHWPRLVQSLSPRTKRWSYDLCDDDGQIWRSTDWYDTIEQARAEVKCLIDEWEQEEA